MDSFMDSFRDSKQHLTEDIRCVNTLHNLHERQSCPCNTRRRRQSDPQNQIPKSSPLPPPCMRRIRTPVHANHFTSGETRCRKKSQACARYSRCSDPQRRCLHTRGGHGLAGWRGHRRLLSFSAYNFYSPRRSTSRLDSFSPLAGEGHRYGGRLG